MSMQKESGSSIVSAGIDVGTTSCHVTLSRLGLSNTAVANQAPRLTVGLREIIYQSPIFFTPLTDEGTIDGAAIAEIIKSQYAAAGITACQVQTGAAIITGESARRRNAAAVIEALSTAAGDFVAASAGPHLESILSARGSGAAQASRQRQRTICNIDIGGGTTNVAVFANGELLDTSCLALGGRCLQLSQEGKLLAVSESGEIFLDAIASPATIGACMEPEFLEHLGNLLSETIVSFFQERKPCQIASRLLSTDALRQDYVVDEYWFSGGVAEIMKYGGCQPLQFGDLGVYLAKGLLACLSERQLDFHIPDMPIRATVVGAGMHALQLSGSTICPGENCLPLKNVPLIRPFKALPHLNDIEATVPALINQCIDRHDLDWSEAPLAIMIDQVNDLGYRTLTLWAKALAGTFLGAGGKNPLIVIARQDIGMALGQLLRGRLQNNELLVVDGIDCAHGDFIDIGAPLPNHSALPVVLKDLVFPS